MRHFVCVLFMIVLLGLVCRAAIGDDLHVPGEYPTIQDAVDAAVDGDVILLADGDYPESISIVGKAIRLRPASPYCTPPCIRPARIQLGGDLSFGYLSLEILDVVEGEVVFEGLSFWYPHAWDRPEDSTLHITNANVAFEHIWFAGGGGTYLQDVIFIDSSVRFQSCFNWFRDGPFMMQLDSTDVVFNGSELDGSWFLWNVPGGESSASFTNTEFADVHSRGKTGIFQVMNPGPGNQVPRMLPEGYTLPPLTLTGCALSATNSFKPFRISGLFQESAALRIDGMITPPDDDNVLAFDIEMNGGAVEFVGCDVRIAEDEYISSIVGAPPRMVLNGGASLRVADCVFRGMRNRGGRQLFAAFAGGGDLTIERTDFLTDHPSVPGVWVVRPSAWERDDPDSEWL